MGKKTPLKHKLLLLLCFCLFVLVFWYFHLPCVFLKYLHIPCPGCGMSRALLALLKFDFSLAFEMHPLVFLLPVAVIIYFTRRLIPEKVLRLIYTTGLILLVTVYFVRLNGSGNVVYADFESGIIYKIINIIKEVISLFIYQSLFY